MRGVTNRCCGNTVAADIGHATEVAGARQDSKMLAINGEDNVGVDGSEHRRHYRGG